MNETPIKFAARINPSVLAESTSPDQTFDYIDIGSVGTDGMIERPAETTRFADAPSRARRLASPGSTIVSTVRTYLRAIAYVDHDLASSAVFSTGFAVLEPRPQFDPRFFHYACRSETFVEEVVARSVGVSYPAIAPAELGALRISTPTLDEQRRVADFLDDQVARIDETILLREQQIAALRVAFGGKVRLAVGGAALTRHHVDSNVPWIGAIHPHASIQALRRSLILQRGVDLTAEGRREGEYPVVTTGGIVGFHDRAIADGPGVVIGRYGTVGSVFWMKGPYWPHNTTLYVKDFKGNDRRYAYWLLRAFPYDMQQARAAVPGVNRNDLHPVAMPHLPLPLQQRAVEWIDTEERKLDALCAEMTAQVGLLTERKRSLITSAVTGQFDIATASSQRVVAV